MRRRPGTPPCGHGVCPPEGCWSENCRLDAPRDTGYRNDNDTTQTTTVPTALLQDMADVLTGGMPPDVWTRVEDEIARLLPDPSYMEPNHDRR